MKGGRPKRRPCDEIVDHHLRSIRIGARKTSGDGREWEQEGCGGGCSFFSVATIFPSLLALPHESCSEDTSVLPEHATTKSRCSAETG